MFYDLYRIAADNVFGDEDNFGEDCVALFADAGAVFVPFGTGAGLATRAGRKGVRGLVGRTGRDTFGEARFGGLVGNRPLSELTDTDVVKAFAGTPFTFAHDSHAISRILDPRTRGLGANSLNDIARLLNKATIVDAGGGDIAIQLGRLEAIVQPSTGIIETIRPRRRR